MTNSPNKIVTRRATPADAEPILALTEAAYDKYVPLLGRKPQPMTANYHQMAAEHPIWLLYLNDQLIGVLALICEADALLIYSVSVNPAYQKQGFGRFLLALAEQQAQQNGYSCLRLYTNALMVENITLYKRVGYKETGRESYLGSTIVHMAKQLTP